MAARVTPIHYLRPNDRNWSPPSVIFLDTETRAAMVGNDEVHTLRCWVAHHVDRRPPRKGTPRDTWGDGVSPADLADWLEAAMVGKQSVWLFAHNLSFDLTVGRMHHTLTRRGWTIGDASIGGKSPWIRLSRKGKTLTLVDSWSWLPYPLSDIAERVGITKPKLPGAADSAGLWLARCTADVQIMESAMRELMAWWDEHKLGNWTLTGPGTGWNAYRHTPTMHRVTVDPDPAQVKADRAAVHGGRRGTWSIGSHAAGPFLELDFTAAYPTVAAWEPHPVARAYPFTSLPVTDPLITSDRWGVAARVVIASDAGHWPARIDGASWYPVGRFHADLAGPDIAEAARLGALESVGAGQVHQLAPQMSEWAAWCLDVQHGYDDTAPAVARMACKTWGRSTIGKWAAHGFEQTRLGAATGTGWGMEEGWDHTAGAAGQIVDLAGVRFWVNQSDTADNAYPAVLAWVESAVRVRLGRVITALGPGCILQCDTDGLIVAQRTMGTRAARGLLRAPSGLSGQARVQWVLNCLDPIIAPLSIRIKARHAHVDVLGPQHVTVDGQRRFSGLPKTAAEQDDGSFTMRTWPKLSYQLNHADSGGYVRPLVRRRITGPYPTGWILADRTVVPVEASISAAGETVIVPWYRTRYAAAGLHRADVQHPVLERHV